MNISLHRTDDCHHYLTPNRHSGTNFSKILNSLSGMFSEDRNKYLAGFGKFDLLIIDDLGIERNSEYAQEQPQTQSLDLSALIEQLQKSPELANTLVALISSQKVS